MTAYGYMRISTNETKQSFLRQESQLLESGIAKENIFKDAESGTSDFRKGFNALLSQIKEGDSLTVCEFSRASRSIQTLIKLADDLNAKGCEFVSLKENIDTRTAEGKLFYTIIAAFAAFEVDLIRQRTQQGLEAARKQGRRGGRPRINQAKIKTAIALYQADEMSISQITEATGVSKSALYRALEKEGIKRHADV